MTEERAQAESAPRPAQPEPAAPHPEPDPEPGAVPPEPNRDDGAERDGAATPDTVSTQRVFKKSSSNNKLTIYLGSRDVVITNRVPEKVRGVVVVDPDYLQDRKVYGQITLTFRYGREDEEVMGLKFCNEAIMCLAQLHPPHGNAQPQSTTPLQDALLRRLGPNAHAFCMELTPLAPPSVQLVPAKEYTGAPIGTSYDVRAYVGNSHYLLEPLPASFPVMRQLSAYESDRPEEKVHRRSMVRMGIRVLHVLMTLPGPADHPLRTPLRGRSPLAQPSQPTPPAPPAPHVVVDKPFLLSDGKVELEASLDKSVYNHGDTVKVNLMVRNNSNKNVRRIKVFVVQHVDVCMFSNGKFKNVVALINSREQCPLGPGGILNREYTLNPEKGTTKNWIALEDSFSRIGAPLASTVTCTSNSPEDRNVFAIYVSYYVKVKLLVGAMGGELSVKLPFTLMHSSYDRDQSSSVPSVPCIDIPNSKPARSPPGSSQEVEQHDKQLAKPRRASSKKKRQPQQEPPPQLQAEQPGQPPPSQQLRDADAILPYGEDRSSGT